MDDKKFLKLKEDVERFVKNKIQSVKYVDEILSLGGFIIEESNLKDTPNKYDDLLQFKKNLQLTMNVYSDAESYKDFKVKLYSDDWLNVSPKKYYRQSDDTNNIWTYYKHPEETDVIEAMFNYVLCFLSIQLEEEAIANSERVITTDSITVCSFCDSDIHPGESHCTTCGESVEEIAKHLMKDAYKKTNISVIENKEDVDEEIKNDPVQYEPERDDKEVQGRHLESDVSGDNVRREVPRDEDKRGREKSVGSTFGDGDLSDKCAESDDRGIECAKTVEDSKVLVNQWTCAKCGLINDDEYISCDACTEMRYEVDNKSAIKSALIDIMTENKQVSPINDRDRWDRWKCPNCDISLPDTLVNCYKCRRGRTDNSGMKAPSDPREQVIMQDAAMVICRDNDPLDGGNANTRDGGPIKDMKTNVNKREIKEDNKGGSSRPDNRVAGDMHRMDGRGMAKEEVKVSVNQWTCAKCGLINDNILLSCLACSEMRMKDRDDDPMKTIAIDGGGAGPGGRKQWKCSRCDLSYAYTVTECIKCHSGRYFCGVWECAACTVINKCRDGKCGVCYKANDGLSMKYCKKCNKSMGHTTRDHCTDCTTTTASAYTSYRWRCTFRHCQALNDKNIEYCHKCNVYRYASEIRGDSVLRSDGREVWICHKCYSQNYLSRSDCYAPYCYETRYGRRSCTYCHTYNYGSTSDCSKCHKPL